MYSILANDSIEIEKMNQRMTIPQICDLIFSATAHTSSFWKFYCTVSLATVGYVFAAKIPLDLDRVHIGLIVVFTVFAISNCAAIYRSQSQTIAVFQLCTEQAAKELGKDHNFIKALNQTKPTAKWRVLTYHVTLDFGVICLIAFAKNFR
ncbi:hypothetical protein [Gimesia aquarii]|uniref:Uncharacterized protein n=1 Tax=Gimesia aquarii TaxID=2527964 RepID=A0A517X009_9PLAN|nr:hypothetical protein [Gimesia aquarii]QDU10844.1 hypothetical protein V202x_42570 [Gimesia aquarii]